MEEVDQGKFSSLVDLCTNVLEVCLRHFVSQGTQFNVGLQCLGDPEAEYHFLFSGTVRDGESREERAERSEVHDSMEEERCLECLKAGKQ